MHEGGERSPSSSDVFPCLKFLQAPSLAQSDVESSARMEWKESRGWQVKETLYFHVTLEPHLKHSGVRTGGRILFLAEIPVDAAKKKATNPDDDDQLCQVAQTPRRRRTAPDRDDRSPEVGGGRSHAIKLPCPSRSLLKTFLDTIRMRQKMACVCGCLVQTPNKRQEGFQSASVPNPRLVLHLFFLGTSD